MTKGWAAPAGKVTAPAGLRALGGKVTAPGGVGAPLGGGARVGPGRGK